MKILFVHEVSYESKVVFEMHELPELLARNGHEIVFVDFPEDDVIWPPRLRAREREINGRVHSDTTIKVISMARWFPYPIDRVICAVRSLISMSLILRRERPDVVICYSVPTNGWQTVIAARLTRIPILFRAIDVSHELRKSIFRPLIRAAERYIYRNCDRILANNPALLAYCIENGADTKRCKSVFPGTTELPSTTTECSNADGWANVVFMGTLFRFSGLDSFLECMATNPKAKSVLRIDVLGDGEDRKRLEELVSNLGLEAYVRFRGLIPFDFLRSTMSTAKIGLLPFRESRVTRFALPGKVPQYVQVGLATVSTPLDGLQSLMPDSIGVSYRRMGPEFIDEVIRLLEFESERIEIVDKGQLRIRDVADWTKTITLFEDEIKDVIKGAR